MAAQPREEPVTAAQKRVFWRLFSAAARALGLPADEREAYRRAVLREEGGVEHLADLGRTHGFDAVCLRLCLDAEDYDGAARYEVGDARRMGAIVEAAIREIVAGTPTAPEAYLRGVFAHAHMPFPGTEEWYLDVSTDLLRSIMQMVLTHRRRLHRRAPVVGVDLARGPSWTSCYPPRQP